jgi:AraC-like DNA-binding protein
MSFTLSVASIFPLAGAANAVLLSAALGAQAVGRRSRAGVLGAAFLAGAACAVAVITFDHAGADAGWLLPFLEGALTLASGAVFLLFIAALVGREVSAFVFAPLVVFVLAAAAAPDFVLDRLSIEYLVLVQAAFTAGAAWLALTAPRADGRLSARRRTLALAAVGVMALVHAAQALRAASDAALLRDLVPYVLGIVFFVLAGLVYFGARAAALEPVLSLRQASPEAAALAARIATAMSQPEVLGKADLGIGDVAAQVGATPQAAAEALRAAHNMTFKEYLVRLRVRAAERLLLDPAEARSSADAIGLLAGFGSRSAFYKAFRDVTGMSPAAYREKSRPET